jgi:hypothetical protein
VREKYIKETLRSAQGDNVSRSAQGDNVSRSALGDNVRVGRSKRCDNLNVGCAKRCKEELLSVILSEAKNLNGPLTKLKK